jgi:hypothetical protein
MGTHIRQNISMPAGLSQRLRELAHERGSTLSGLIVHLVTTGLAVEEGGDDPLLRYVGSISGPADLSATVDETVYGH